MSKGKTRLFSVLRKLACNSVEQQESPSLPLVSARWGARRSPGDSAPCLDRMADIHGGANHGCGGVMPALESDGGHQEAQEVLNTLLLREGRDITDPLWLIIQRDSLVDIRSTLLGWLRTAIIAHHQCSITTLEHAINLLDRFLFKTGFMGGRAREMELAAVAAFSLAAKMEEVYVPSLADELQAGAPWQRFRPAEIELMEWAILKVLSWRLACVTASDLVQPMLEASPAFRFQTGSLPVAAAAGAGPLGAAAARGLAESSGASSLERRQQLGARVRKKAFGLLLASVTDPELTQYKASEVAAASLALAVDSVCRAVSPTSVLEL